MFHCEEVFSRELHKKLRNGEKQSSTISFLFTHYHFLFPPRFSFQGDFRFKLRPCPVHTKFCTQNVQLITNLFLVTFAIIIDNASPLIKKYLYFKWILFCYTYFVVICDFPKLGVV